jgi:hypothetical protein
VSTKNRISGALVAFMLVFVVARPLAAQQPPTSAADAPGETSPPAEKRRGFIGFSVGPSTPFGNFADASSTNARGGRAFPGYSSNLVSIVYPIGQRFGVAAAGSYGEYVWRDGGDDDWWQVATLAVGPMYSQRLSAKAALDLKAMFGLITMSPVIDGFGDPANQGNSLGADLRATLRYDVFRRWAVYAEGGIQASNVSFRNGDRKDYRAAISGFGIAFQPAW